MVLQEGEAFYLAPNSVERDVIGLPIRVTCRAMFPCFNSAGLAASGFALRRDVDLFFMFEASEYMPSEWIALHHRLEAVVGTLLLDH